MTELARGCSHLREFKQSNGLHSYQVIYKYLVKPQLVNSEARKVKVNSRPCFSGLLFHFTFPSTRPQARTCICNVCRIFSLRLHTCLHCVYFGCQSPDNHMQQHVQATGHMLGQLVQQELLCDINNVIA